MEEKEPKTSRIVKAILKASEDGKLRRGMALFLMLTVLGGTAVGVVGCCDNTEEDVTTYEGDTTTATQTTTGNNEPLVPSKPVSSELESIIMNVCGFDDFDYDFLTSSDGEIKQLHLAGTALVDGVKKDAVLSYDLDEETYAMLKEVELDVDI